MVELKSLENIMSVFFGFNIWWELGNIEKDYAKIFKRGIYYKVWRTLKSRNSVRVIKIVGMNRTGKTVLLQQIIQEMLNQGISPKKILYIPCKHSLFRFLSLTETLKLYRENVCGDDEVYFFLDDIHLVKSWETELRDCLSAWPQTHFIIAGTVNSDFAEKNNFTSKELCLLHNPTLSFYEYCKLVAPKNLPSMKNSYLPWELAGISRQEAKDLFQSLSDIYPLFLHYMETGGFPGIAFHADKIRIRHLLQEGVVGEALHLDIPSNFNIRDISDLDKVYFALSVHSGNIISYEALSKEIGSVSRPTVEKYLDYLERANLVYINRPVSLDNNQINRKTPQIYISDQAIRNIMIMNDYILTNTELKNSGIKTAVYKHTYSYSLVNPGTTMGFCAASRGRGIDIVLNLNGRVVFLDVYYFDSYRLKPSDCIWSMNNQAQSCIIITRLSDDFGQLKNGPEKLYRIPAAAFLYLMGHAEYESYRY